MILESKIDGKVETINDSKINVGDTGKSIGRLAPMGKVKVNGEIIEAQSTGSFIDQNKEIRILKILSNKIIVELIN
jgi:membrane-bound ClpP family serine protease